MRELREIRLRRGLSQADLSGMTGVAEFTISEIESGKRANPRPSTLRKLAQALEVEVADLYGEPAYPKDRAPSSTQPPLNSFEEERREPKVHTGAANLKGAGKMEDVGEGFVLIGREGLARLLGRVERRELSANEAMAVAENAEIR